METIKTTPDKHTDENTGEIIADNIQRTVERTALRKVRKLVDEVQQQDANQRVIQKHVVAAALTCVVAFFALQAWQKAQQQKADRSRDAIYACEYRASQEELPHLREDLAREHPNLDPVEFRKRLMERQAAVWIKVRRQCEMAGAT